MGDYSMTIEQYIDRLTSMEGLVKGDLADNTIAIAGAELLDSIKKRIVSGKNSNGSQIGNYSHKPLYASVGQFVKQGTFIPLGKNSNQFNITYGDRIIQTHKILTQKKGVQKIEQKFIVGNHTTTLSKGYSRRPQYSLVKPNYQPRKTMYQKQGYYGLRGVQGIQNGFVDQKYTGSLLNNYTIEKENNTTYLIGFTDELQSAKRKGNEKHFAAPIYSATEQEKQEYINRSTQILGRLTRDILEQGIYAQGRIS